MTFSPSGMWFLSLTLLLLLGAALAGLLHLRRKAMRLEAALGQRTRERDGARDYAEQMTAFQGLCIAALTHDFRPSLQLVQDLTEHLLEQMPEEAARGRRILQATAIMKQRMEDLLELARLEAAPASLRSRPFDLRPLVLEVAELLRERAEGKGLALIVDIDPALSAGVAGDEARVRQLLFHLAGAVTFIPDGHIHFRVQRRADQVRIVVEDMPPGAPLEPGARRLLSGIQGGGSGPGLSLVRRLATLMGGQAGAETSGLGSVYWCQLPLPAALLPEAADLPEEDRAPARLSGKVLVADYNPSCLRHALFCLEELGLEARGVEDGLQALEALEEDSFDAVILDDRMPGLSGPATLQVLRQRPETAALPVFRFTSNVDGLSLDGDVRYDGILVKPAELPDYQRLLSRFLPVPGEALEGRSAHLDSIRLAQLREVLGDQATLEDFIRMFQEDARRRVKRIRAALEAGDFETLALQAHDLKTNAGNLGLTFLARSAMVLEQGARMGAGSRVTNHLARLEAALSEAFRLVDEGRLQME